MTISVINEIPETLHSALAVFLDNHPLWDADRVTSAALALFLAQQPGVQDECRADSESVLG